MKLIKIPFGGGGLGHGDGAKHAPDRIVGHFSNMFLNEDLQTPRFEIDEIIVDNSNLSFSHHQIYNKLRQIKERAILLGGDNSISAPAFKAFAENNPGAGLILFDAHPDLMESIGVSSQEDWLRSLIAQGILDPDKVIIIGVRNSDAQEIDFIRSNNIKVYSMKHIFDVGVENVCDGIMEQSRQWPALYVCFDIDAVDPAFAPGTGYREPGGLSAREMIYFVQRLKKLKNFKMCDIVEVNPELDVAELTSKLAAKLVYELS